MNDSNSTLSISIPLPRDVSQHAGASEDDQVLRGFLTLLDDDIRSHPEKLIALDSTLLARLDSLIGGLDVDINFPLSADDE